MVRVVWYQHRGALLGLGAVVVALGALLLAAGLRGRGEYAFMIRHGWAAPGLGLIGLNPGVNQTLPRESTALNNRTRSAESRTSSRAVGRNRGMARP